MPRVRDLLYRFRPAGAPGPASAAAVPSDRVADRTTELEPVFALLVGTEAECRAIREEAERAAVARRAQARETARRTLAEAESAVEQERARTAAAVADSAAAESASAADAAAAEAERLLARARERTPGWATRVAAEVDDLLAGSRRGSGR